MDFAFQYLIGPYTNDVPNYLEHFPWLRGAEEVM
jgi:hypothetical protein